MARVPFFSVLFLSLLMAACAGTPPGTPAGADGTNENPTTVSAARTSGPESLPKPESLIGKNADAVEDVMGEPMLIRRDGPAEIWQYIGTGCTANLFLYRAEKGAATALSYIEARGHDGKRMDAAACFVMIEKNRLGS